MKSLDYTTLNPGIRKVVQFLRENGFDTCDSGDGVTHEHACDLDRPYVHILVQEPAKLVAEADRLTELLSQHGIKLEPQDEEVTARSVEASYWPASQTAVMSLWNVTDTDLG